MAVIHGISGFQMKTFTEEPSREGELGIGESYMDEWWDAEKAR